MVTVIWSNDYDAVEEYAQAYMEAGHHPDDAFDLAVQDIDAELEDFLDNAESISGEFVIYGKNSRWDGRRDAWKYVPKHSLRDAVSSVLADGSNTFYLDGPDLFWTHTGHDNPVNPSVMRIRRAKDDVCEDDFYEAEFAEFDDMSEPIGWKLLLV